jgi:hypothetical protein
MKPRTSIHADEVAQSITKGEFEEAIAAFNAGAQAAGKKIKSEMDPFVRMHEKAMNQTVSAYVTGALKEAVEKATKPEDKDHEKKARARAGLSASARQSGLLRCESDTKDLNLLAGRFEQRIATLKKEEAYFKMAVNLGGLAFDGASNFLAPLLTGGALLRMSQSIFKAVKRWADFANFCDSKKAMIKCRQRLLRAD